MAANLEAEQEIDAPYSMGEGSMSMSDGSLPCPLSPSPVPSPFTNMNSSPISTESDNKVV
jgi:hypothetical protein